MDKILVKNKAFLPKPVLIGLVGTVVGLVIILIASGDYSSKRVDIDKVSTGTVKSGTFNFSLHASGQLKPKNVEWVASQVDGVVNSIFVRSGDRVEAGQVILRMINPELINMAEETEEAYEGALVDLVSYRSDLESQLLNQESSVVQARYKYNSRVLQLEAETKLLERGGQIIAEIDYRRTKLAVLQLQEIYSIEEKKLEHARSNKAVQIEARQRQVNQAKNVMLRAQKKVASLSIVAGMAGTIQGLNVKVGQRLINGTELTKVLQQDQLYAELRVQAEQARHLQLQQSVNLDLRSDIIEGYITRIDPVVEGGYVDIDVELHADFPAFARPELRVEGEIIIVSKKNSIFVSRPAFAKANSVINVYLLDKDESYAVRRQVQLGDVSVNQVEILDGLQPGEVIITSESSDWISSDRVYLN